MQRKGGQVYARERERRKIRGMPSKDAQQGKVIGVDNRSRRKKGMREKGGEERDTGERCGHPKTEKEKKRKKKSERAKEMEAYDKISGFAAPLPWSMRQFSLILGSCVVHV